MRKDLEIETKYKALCTLEQFKHVCEMLGSTEYINAQGYDHFYSREDDKNSFFRYRVDSGNGETELTYKQKLIEHNSIIRIEHNLHLKDLITDNGEEFCFCMGYQFNSIIWKNSHIYIFKSCVLCYYTIEDVTGDKEDQSFIEIELKDIGQYEDEWQAMKKIEWLEHAFAELEISKEQRINESLFEMYRRR